MTGIAQAMSVHFLVLLLVQGVSAQSFAVPNGDGRPVMTDGILNPEEWEDAHRVLIGGTAALLFKEHMGHVFVGVDCRELGKPFSMNLYVARPNGKIHQLHASAQLGERVISQNEEEDPPWVWGWSPDWYANEGRWNQALAQSLIEEGETRTDAQRQALFPQDGFEFQIRRSKFDGDRWLVRVEIRSSPDYDSPLVYPVGTSGRDTRGWVTLDFQGGVATEELSKTTRAKSRQSGQGRRGQGEWEPQT